MIKNRIVKRLEFEFPIAFSLSGKQGCDLCLLCEKRFINLLYAKKDL